MKFMALLILAFPTFALAGNFLTFQEYQKLNSKQKVEIITIYKEFVKEVLKNENDMEALTSSARFSFFTEAYAAGKYDCFYAGWPSQKKTVTSQGKKKTFCSSPLKSNAAYQALSKSCGAGQLLCQPVLFGAGLCIETKTQEQKNSAFSQCEKKFKASGKGLADLAKDLSSETMSPLADEMFALVHDICEAGAFQSKTPMCGNLKKKVAAVKENRTEKIIAKTKDVQVLDQGKAVEDVILKEKLITTVNKVDDVVNISEEVNSKVNCDKCEQMKNAQLLDEVLAPYEASEAIDQNRVTEKDYCSGNQKGTQRQKYSQSAFSDYDNGVSLDITYQQNGEDKEHRVVGGYGIDADRMGKSYSYVEEGVEYPSEEMEAMYPKRSYSDSFEGRGKESVFEIVDMPVREEFENKKLKERFLSTDIRMTQLTFFPRKNVPSVKKRDDKLIMKLTTGEEITVDSKSGRVVSGAAKEIPAKNQVEVRPTNKRTFPDTDFTYQGEGLFIESKVTYNNDERKPGNLVPVKAIVNGKQQVCKLKSDDIWQYDYGSYIPHGQEGYLSSEWSCTRLKFQKDEELYALIRKTCPAFQFPPLVK
jgi:hypothetical protein